MKKYMTGQNFDREKLVSIIVDEVRKQTGPQKKN